MRSAFRMTAVLVLTAHGSVDPRAAANTHAIAERIRRDRPGLDVRLAFCETSTPNVRDVVAEIISLRASGSPPIDGRVVVTPLLLADAYHARVDIPAMIANSGALQADVLGEDHRLLTLMRHRGGELGVWRLQPH